LEAVLIAVVICTIQGREEMLKRALACVETQTGVDVYPLIVADYEHDLGGILVAPGESYAKRLNLAARVTKAEWIAHFDDDDVSAPGRLAYQLEHIGNHAVCGFNRITIQAGDDLWHYHGPESYGCGASLLYRREWVLRNPFDELVPNEDLYFTAQAHAAGQYIALDGREYLTATKHAGNTSMRLEGKEFTYAGRKADPPHRNSIPD
jgi:glycosyltransferase involved in cell wall biosynthesis